MNTERAGLASDFSIADTCIRVLGAGDRFDFRNLRPIGGTEEAAPEGQQPVQNEDN